MYEIRKVNRPSEIPSLFQSIEHWVGYIEHRSRQWWAAFEQTPEGLPSNNWVGFAGLQIFNETTVLISPCEVDEDARGNGLQKRFIQVREQWALDNSYDKALSLTNYENIISANNLIKCGYILIEPWPGANGRGQYFEKNLRIPLTKPQVGV